MKYSDELDRISPSEGLSRRQFLTAGGHHAARLAGAIVPAAGKRLLDGSSDPAALDDSDEQPDRREG